jgi:hypothetical protein
MCARGLFKDVTLKAQAEQWPGSLSGQGVTALVHESLVPKVLGCKVSAPGAVVQGVWLEVQGDVFGLPGSVMVASVCSPPRTAARSAEQIREAFRVLLDEAALALHGCTDLCLLGDFNAKIGNMPNRHTDDTMLPAFPTLPASRHSVLPVQVNGPGHLLLDVAAALRCVLLTERGHGDEGQSSCFDPLLTHELPAWWIVTT